MIKLSICVATFNRADFIAETLDSIVSQIPSGVELVIVDGASPDNTEEVIAPYVSNHSFVRYFKETENSGVDADFDKAVGYARGEHCWLMPDDDLMLPGAIDRVLDALEGGKIDLLIVDEQIRDFTLRRVLNGTRLNFKGEREYSAKSADDLLRDSGYCLSFIGGVIIRKELWLSRDRESYFGSLFIHVGVIFQRRDIGRAKVMAEPLIAIRAGNAMWRPRGFEIWAFKWPELIWSFEGYSDVARKSVTPREPWRKLSWLLGYRALGAYSMEEYEKYFSHRPFGIAKAKAWLAAVFPARPANFLALFALTLAGKGGESVAYDLVNASRFSNRASRALSRPFLGQPKQALE